MATADINHNNLLNIKIAFQNDMANVKRVLMAAVPLKDNNTLTI